MTPVPVHASGRSSRLCWVARLKQPAGTADWWECASHQDIREPRDVLGTPGSPRLDTRAQVLQRAWSANSHVECDKAKMGFFFHLEDLQKLETQIHPYFKNLVPLMKEWYGLMRNNDNPDSVPFDAVLEMLDRHHAELPKDEPSPELLFARTILK
ncbi:uncharacterized protein HD556DRAFT_1310391 [Suillus plorans]|uniref:Uncharacterized protein n=1 Tax=Suillus plorans TaxID=116603 RepID=A0A9P7ALJ2_9AGAM|nr:uncharacterized protein HD556DRAFT_1310391 [Suillus plorans]KAG1790855.1 hypothetical protein HD556DRAFT_1310391 [Suillus plorans]